MSAAVIGLLVLAGQPATAQQPLIAQLSPVGASGVSGNALLTPQGPGTQVSLDLTGLPPGTRAEARIQAGSCALPSASAVELPDLTADAAGHAQAAGPILFRGTDPVALSTFLQDPHVLTIVQGGSIVACGSITQAAPGQIASAQFTAAGGSGVSGTALLSSVDGGTRAVLDVAGLPPGVTAEVRLHAGTCGQPAASAVPLPDLTADPTGRARAAGTILFRGTEAVPLSTFLQGPHVIVISLPAGVVACGTLQAISAAPTATATAAPGSGPTQWLDRPPASGGATPTCPSPNQWLLLYWGGDDGVSIRAAADGCPNGDVYWTRRGAAWLGFRKDLSAASDAWMLARGEAHFVHGAAVTAGPQGGTVRDYASFVDALRAQGAVVQPADQVHQPFIAVPGRLLEVNGEDVQVFEFADAAAASAAAAQLPPRTVSISWIAPPHFYLKERIIVIYVGNNASVLALLSSLLGPPFAGEER
jgi:hypothetical protein